MKLTKFERRRQDIEKKHQEELRALEEAEAKERRKLIDPVVEKMAKVAEEEARKLLERSPEILETYGFRKREAAKALSAAMEELFSASQEGDGSGSPTPDASKAEDVAPGNSAPAAEEGDTAAQERGARETAEPGAVQGSRESGAPDGQAGSGEPRRGFFQRD